MLAAACMEVSGVLGLVMLQTSFLLSAGAGVHYEYGYMVTTDFLGNQAGMGVHIHSISRDLRKNLYLVVDSSNSTLLTMTLPLSEKSVVKAIAGSGVPGYRDGVTALAEFNHPHGAVVDDEGNIYVADSRNAAIRKISDGRVTTIAGGLTTGFEDGDGEDAKFSADFDLYLDRTICDLIVADRGNNAVRKIRLDIRCCRNLWDISANDVDASALDRKFMYGIAAGAAAMFVLAVLFWHRMLLQTWTITALEAVWGGAGEVLSAIWSVFFLWIDRFRQAAAPEHAQLLSNKAQNNEQAGLLPPLIDFTDHPAECKHSAEECRLPIEDGLQRDPTFSDDRGWGSGSSFRQKALTLPTVMTPDFVPALRPDVDEIDDPTAGVSLTVQKALKLPTVMTPDFIPAVGPDVDEIDDPSAGVSLPVSRSGTEFEDCEAQSSGVGERSDDISFEG